MTNNTMMELFSFVKAFRCGGSIHIMNGIDKEKSDFKAILSLAALFAKDGHKVMILTSCHFKSIEYQMVFGKLIGTKYDRKCPDLMIDGKYYEYEGFERPWKKEKVRRMISHGMKQSSHIIINNTRGASDRFIRQAIIARLNVGATIREIWLYEKGAKRLFFKDGVFQ